MIQTAFDRMFNEVGEVIRSEGLDSGVAGSALVATGLALIYGIDFKSALNLSQHVKRHAAEVLLALHIDELRQGGASEEKLAELRAGARAAMNEGDKRLS